MSKALQFPRSDGTQTRWPDKLDPTPINGEVNYMKPIDYNDSLAVRWRASVGREVAKLLGYEDFTKYTIEDFPEGYRFFLHHKGPPAGPRTDPYLYGSPAGRFRSAPEFIRHAYWLFTDETLNRTNCKCKYCSSSKSQTEISRDLGLTSSGGGVRIPYGDPNKPKLRPVARPQKKAGMPLSTDRVADLRGTRTFRCGELVWAALYPAIEGENNYEQIEFWPAFITEFNLKVDVGSNFARDPWAVTQHHTYGVRLLGLPRSDTLPESSLLPYQAYGPSTALVDRLRVTGNPALLSDENSLANLCPTPLGTTNFVNKYQLEFRDAATPFAFAIQIAAQLVRFWTPVQEYTFQGEVPSTSSQATQATDGRKVVELKENRCQGLWWGAERIWMDELVRLQPSRAQVFAGGSNLIYPPSPRADGRGVLMRINSILSLPGETKDSPRICKVAGILYELAEESYEEEPQSQLQQTPQPQLQPQLSHSSTIPSPPPVAVLSSPTRSSPTRSPESSQRSPKIVRPFHPEKQALADPFVLKARSPGLAHMPPYSLPEPPPGFKFRPILKSGYELVLDVTFIAGRYYSGLYKHPLLKEALDDPTTNEARIDQLRSLVGLISGAINSMECTEWTATRAGMFQAAGTTAHQDLLNHWRRDTDPVPPVIEQNQDQPEAGPSASAFMDVDPT